MLYKQNVNNSSTKLHDLAQLAIFRELSQKDLIELSHITTTSHVRKGHIFYRQEEISETVFILQQGSVQLYRISPDGRKLIVTTLRTQALFDEVTLIADDVHHTFAEAADDCVLYVADRLELKRVIQRNPKIILRLLENTSKRLHTVEARLESLAYKDVAARVSELLLELAEEQGNNRILGFTHQELAEFVGTYRETATQVLGELKSLGCIDIGRKRIDILDAGGLEAVVFA